MTRQSGVQGAFVLSPTLQTFRYAELSQLQIPDISSLATNSTLATLDLTGRVAHGIDSTIETVANTVTTAVPKGARLVTSLFPLPDTVDTALIGTVDFITQGGMWLAKISATASVQALLFGAPAWTQAVRTGVAVYGTAAQLHHGDSSAQFLARCLGEASLPAHHRETFKNYLELAKERAALDANGPESQAAALRIEQQLSLCATQLGNSVDLSTVHKALQGATSFAKEFPEVIQQTADRLAESIVDNVQGFYINRLGSSAGRVAGSWEREIEQAIRTSQQQATKSALAKRLTSIFSEDLSPHETAVRINKIAATLNSSFGTYRHAFIGILGLGLGVAWQSGALQAHATVAWGYITGGVGYAVRVSTSAIRKGITNALTWGKDKVKDSVEEIASDLKKTIKEQVKSSLTQNPPSSEKSNEAAQIGEKAQPLSSQTTVPKPTPHSDRFDNQIVIGAQSPRIPKVVVTPNYTTEVVVHA